MGKLDHLRSKSKRKRESFDAYVTPRVAIQALLEREIFEGSIWEPAAGTGVIIDELKLQGYKFIYGTDIRQTPGAFSGQLDFLKDEGIHGVDNIITNPPYSLALEFAKQALKYAQRKVALFLRLNFLEGRKRYVFFKQHPPQRIYIFSNRLSCLTETGEPLGVMVCFAWFIWDIGSSSRPTLDWILIEDPNALKFKQMMRKKLKEVVDYEEKSL